MRVAATQERLPGPLLECLSAAAQLAGRTYSFRTVAGAAVATRALTAASDLLRWCEEQGQGDDAAEDDGRRSMSSGHGAQAVEAQVATVATCPDVPGYLTAALVRWRGEVVDRGPRRAGEDLAGRVEHAIRLLRGGR